MPQHKDSKGNLQNKLDELGLDIDLEADKIEQREAYQNALKNVENAENGKEKAKAERYLKIAERQYFLHFHEYVKQQLPHFLFDKTDDKYYWIYNEDTGTYGQKKFPQIRGIIIKMLMDEFLRNNSNESGARDVLSRFKGEYKDCGKLPDDFQQQGDWLHVKNGWLNVKTRKFEKHTPERLSLYTLDTEYKKNAKCPIWDKTVEHLATGDPEQAVILQEFAGYCLTYDAHLDRSLILVGEGQSGKSTFANTIYSLLGQGNATSTDLESINGSFGVFPLVGKRLNWIDEMPTTKYLESQRLKRLISGEPTTAERKYSDEFEFIPTAKFLWTMNEMPRLADTSNGSYRRFIIVECNNVYTDEDKDPKIDDKLREEFSGILNWALLGLKTLYEREDFAITEKNTASIDEYRKDNSPVLDFIDTCFDRAAVPKSGVEGGISAMSLYRAYKDFCLDTGRKPKSSTYFGRELLQDLKHIGYNVEKRRVTTGRYYVGLMPNENEEAAVYHEKLDVYVKEAEKLPKGAF